MIRILIVIVVLFLIWLMFVADFERRKKIVIAVFALAAGGIAVWFEGYGERPKVGIVGLDQVHICGVSSVHSYRSNFNVSVCLQNKAKKGTIQRLTVDVSVEQCKQADQCVLLNTVRRDVAFVLAPDSQQTLEQNLNFRGVDSAMVGLKWSAQLVSVQAVK